MRHIGPAVALVVVGVCGPKVDAVDHVVGKPNGLMMRMIVRAILGRRGEWIRSRHWLAGRPNHRVHRWRMASFDPILREQLAINLYDRAMLTPLGRNLAGAERRHEKNPNDQDRTTKV